VVERAVSRARCIDVIAKAKQSWRRFRASELGYRFQDRYRRQQESEHGWRDPRRLFYLVGGLILAGGSLFLGALPGPGMLTFFVGLAMIAGEFRPVARLLDWAEVWARVFAKRVRVIWRSSAAGKALVVVVAAILVGAVLYVAYLLLFGG
jgi:Flp pilus assembly protein TadB